MHRSICLMILVLFCNSIAMGQVDKPNIVLFLIDDMGIMDTSVPFLTDQQGKPIRYPLNDAYRTPNMERLASKGIRFNQFCAMSVCSPTRISLMTGQNAARHRTTNWINPDKNNGGPDAPLNWNWKGLNKSSVTLAKLLQSNGYRTMHVGKGHFGPRDSEGSDPTNLGFDANIGGCSIGAPGSYYAKQKYGNETDNRRNGVPHLEKYFGSDTFLTEALTQEAKSLVSNAVQDKKPFFLYFPHYAVHAPFNADPRFIEHYANSDRPKNWQAFASLVEGMDKSLGDILDHLDSLQIADNTLVLFLGDNGSDAPLGHEHAVACAAPLRGRKGSHYEGGMRVPFIAAWAKRNSTNLHQSKLPIPAGKIQSQQAAVFDLFPTILKLADVRSPSNHAVDGTSLDTLLSGQSDASRPQTFLMHYPHSPHRSEYFTSFRDGDWKVVYHYAPGKQSDGERYQLFQLRLDPFEQNDLAKTEPIVLKKMMQGLVDALEKNQAVYPIDSVTSKTLSPKLPD
ncbi:MAG: sulfatase [Pirellula sp.]